MTIRIGNAPCSWGVEFADDPRNPPWRQVLKDCADAVMSGHLTVGAIKVKKSETVTVTYSKPETAIYAELWMDGALIETIAGMPFAAFMRERLFAPLGMEDTFFTVPAEKVSRLAVTYNRDAPSASGAG